MKNIGQITEIDFYCGGRGGCFKYASSVFSFKEKKGLYKNNKYIIWWKGGNQVVCADVDIFPPVVILSLLIKNFVRGKIIFNLSFANPAFYFRQLLCYHE